MLKRALQEFQGGCMLYSSSAVCVWKGRMSGDELRSEDSCIVMWSHAEKISQEDSISRI